MKKTILTIVLTAIVCFAVVGTTFAFLVDKTDPIVNTFTVGNVDITLTETDPTPENTADENKYKMVPGNTIAKDPTVTVKANSEACWLFVKVDESANAKDFIEYSAAAGWTTVNDIGGIEGVYYRKVEMSDADQAFKILAGDAVTVKSSVTKDAIDALYTDGAINEEALPTLTFTAYAVQYDAEEIDTAAKAWAIINAPAGS